MTPFQRQKDGSVYRCGLQSGGAVGLQQVVSPEPQFLHLQNGEHDLAPSQVRLGSLKAIYI